MYIKKGVTKTNVTVLDKLFLIGDVIYFTDPIHMMNGKYDYATKVFDSDKNYLGMISSSEFNENSFEIITNNNESVTDVKILDWLQKVMEDDSNYCEIYLAGLRDFSTGKANSYQIESNPEKFETINAPTLRQVIAEAMKLYPIK